MQKIITRAPAKVLLFGEHAVVYGKTAVASSISRYTYCVIDYQSSLHNQHMGNDEKNTNRINHKKTQILLQIPELNIESLEIDHDWIMQVIGDFIILDSNQDQSFNTNEGTPLSSVQLLKLLDTIQIESIKQSDFMAHVLEPKYSLNRSQSTAIVALLSVWYLLCLLSTPKHSFSKTPKSPIFKVFQNSDSIKIGIRSNIPVASGLGSSASYSVALVSNLLIHFGYIQLSDRDLLHFNTPGSDSNTLDNVFKDTKDNKGMVGRMMDERHEFWPTKKMKLDLDELHVENTQKSLLFNNEQLEIINKWAFFAEKVMHGNPSGVDNTVCTFGGFLQYAKSTETSKTTIRKMNQNQETSLNKFSLILTNTNVPKNTKIQVEKVAELCQTFPEIMNPILESMDKIAGRAVRLFQCPDQQLSPNLLKNAKDLDINMMDQLERLVKLNQSLLQSLGVSHESIQSICQVSEKLGLASKLTGAGGGGYVLTLNHPSKEIQIKKFMEKMKSMDYPCFISSIGCDGVQVIFTKGKDQN